MAIVFKAYAHLRSTFFNFSIFLLRDFDSHIDQPTAKRLGRWATRLYLTLLVLVLATLAVVQICQLRMLTKTFDQPTLELLFDRHAEDLRCPCSSSASTLASFVRTQVVLHQVNSKASAEIDSSVFASSLQICSSHFGTDEARLHLTTNLIVNLSTYAANDYRRFLPAHLQLLVGLCQLSQHAANATIEQFYASSLVTTELLSEATLTGHVKTIVRRSELDASRRVAQLLRVIGQIHQGNGAISTYGSNYKYLVPWSHVDQIYATTAPLIYDHGCSCALHSHCTTQATLDDSVSHSSTLLPGLKMGCTPSESFRASSLDCFHNHSCLELLRDQTKVNGTLLLTPLSTNGSRFAGNTTIEQLLAELFIEQWQTTINYSSYFSQCAPSTCLYKSHQRQNILHVINVLIGVHGGLSILLGWACPKLVQLGYKIRRRRMNSSNRVQPVNGDTHEHSSNVTSQSVHSCF